MKRILNLFKKQAQAPSDLDFIPGKRSIIPPNHGSFDNYNETWQFIHQNIKSL